MDKSENELSVQEQRSKDDAKERKRERRTALLRCLIICIVTFLQTAGYGSIVVLQSSINIEDGTGAWSVMSTYIAGAVFNLLVVPSLIRKIGARYTIIFALLTHFLYSIANFFPEPYILIPAGVIVGIGEACYWPCAMIYIMYYASTYAKYAMKSSAACITQFLGLFYTCLSLASIFGNLVSGAILFSGSPPSSNSSTFPNDTFEIDISVCGINDCQDPNITSENIEQYEPPLAARYTLVGTMSGVVLLSMVIFFIGVPAVDFNENKDEKEREEEKSFSTLANIRKSLKHLALPKQLVLSPYALYCGLHISFNVSEMTRAFAACLRGVEEVNAYVLVSAVSNGVMASLVGFVSSRIGRNWPYLFVFVLDIAQYVFLLYWIPTLDTTWVVFVLSAVYGAVDGGMQFTNQDIHGSIFPEKKEFALSAANMYVTIGWAIQYGWSTSLCVETKVYIMIAMSSYSMLMYGVANILYRDDFKQKKTEVTITAGDETSSVQYTSM